eukprot:480523-Rhodomonas_salina.1
MMITLPHAESPSPSHCQWQPLMNRDLRGRNLTQASHGHGHHHPSHHRVQVRVKGSSVTSGPYIRGAAASQLEA